MTQPSPAIMSEATRLTREGRLVEATALLRKTLANASSSSVPIGSASPRTTEKAKPILEMMPSIAGGGVAWRLPQANDLLGLVKSPPHSRRASLPAGARFEERCYSSEAGQRAYKLYVPSSYNGSALPLVVMLHGCTQSPDDFAAGTRMNEHAEVSKFFVAYPEQALSANASKCWNWFNPGDQQEGRGEPALIAGITRQIILDFAVIRGRVYIAGLSAGGAAAAVMSSAYPELFAAVGIHSGLPCGAARDLASAFVAMRNGAPVTSGLSARHIPTIVFHGDQDTTVSPVNGDVIIARAQAATAGLKTDVSEGVSAGGVRYTRTLHADVSGKSQLEQWVLHQAGHAWSGGSPAGSFTEPRGPDASREIIRFFQQHSKQPRARV